MMDRNPTPYRPFVGRERELAELRAGVADALEARGRLFLIVGEAGIGKTRLATEVELAAVAAGARVAWARCWEGGGAPAFWPWTVLVRVLARDCATTTLISALGSGAAVLAQLVPELRERLRDLPVPPAGSQLDSQHARFPLFEAAARFLRRLAEMQPLVLLLDDLHAADLPSLLLLAFLARDMHDARVLFVGTTRDSEALQEPERARLLEAIGRAGHRLPLAGWAEAEVARFVSAASETPPPARLIGALHRLTEGNPFFVDEIVRLLVAQGHGHLPEQLAVRVPDSVRAVVRERLRPLDPDTLRVLTAAAVAGREFDLAVLREACEIGATALLDALGTAEAAGTVRQVDAVGRYAFAHALIRETLYEDLPPAERVIWHRTIGRALERMHAADLEPQLDLIAHHFALAAPVGSVNQAIDYAVRAARHAAALLAFEAAARHYERALQVQALRVPRDEPAALELRLGLGEMQAAAWNLDAARATFRAAADEARRLLWPDGLARAALGFAGLGFGLPRGVVDPEIVALLEEALRLFGERRDALWARVAVRLAVELHFSSDAERRDALSREAVETARQVGDAATLAYVVNARHFAVWSQAEHPERVALADEAVRLADSIGDADLALQGRTWRLLDMAEIGDSIGFDREFEIYAHLADQRRLPRYLGFAAGLRGLRALWQGRFDEAVARADAAMALGERVGDRAAFLSVSVQIFFARRAQGRLAEMEPLVRIWVEQFPAIPASRCLLALLYTDLEREAEARREYERLAVDDFVPLQRRNVLHPLLHPLAEVCAYLGDRGRAALLYRQLLPFAGRVMGLGPNVLFGPASHALGTLADLLDQWELAAQHYETALEETTRMQAPAWLAAVQYDYARRLLAHDAAARASELAAAALERARGLGMPSLAARAGALQASCAEAEGRAAQVAVGWRDTGTGSAPPPAGGRESGARVLRFPVKPPATAAPPRLPAQGVFRCEGDHWTVGYERDVVRLRATSGLRYLARLLAEPGRPVHAVELAAGGLPVSEPAAAAPPSSQAVERSRLNVTRAIRSALRRIAEEHRELGLYLDSTIRTGLYCSYTPDPRVRVVWQL